MDCWLKQGVSKRRRVSSSGTNVRVACPFCATSVLQSLISAHIESTHPEGAARGSQPHQLKRRVATRPPAAAAAGSAAAAAAPSAGAAPPARAAIGAASGNDPFALMMSAAAAPARREWFSLYLGAAPPGDGWIAWRKKWHWRWCLEASDAPLSAWSGEVVLKEPGASKVGAIRLASNVRSLAASAPASFESKLGVQVLQSALQKAVRRRRPAAAVRLARTLQRASWNTFIRRLPIVIIEDSTLHPALPLLVWLMMATSKGFRPTQAHLDACVAIVGEVASCGAWDVGRSAADAAAGVAPPPPPPPLTSAACDALSSSAHAALVRAILARARFGGMTGDIAMLHAYARLWRARFAAEGGEGGEGATSERGRSVAPPPLDELAFDGAPLVAAGTAAAAGTAPTAWVDFLAALHGGDAVDLACAARAAARAALRRADIPLASVDFHCTRVASDVAATMKGAVSEADLRRAMWLFSSSLNRRRRWSAGRVLADGERSAAEEEERAALRPVWAACERRCARWAERYVAARIE